jgi:hypothetical protein
MGGAIGVQSKEGEEVISILRFIQKLVKNLFNRIAYSMR